MSTFMKPRSIFRLFVLLGATLFSTHGISQTCGLSETIKPKGPIVFKSIAGIATPNRYFTLPDDLSATAQYELADAQALVSLIREGKSLGINVDNTPLAVQTVDDSVANQFSAKMVADRVVNGGDSDDPWGYMYVGCFFRAGDVITFNWSVVASGESAVAVIILDKDNVAVAGTARDGSGSVVLPSVPHDGNYLVEFVAAAYAPQVTANFTISSDGVMKALPMRVSYFENSVEKYLYPAGYSGDDIETEEAALVRAMALNGSGVPIMPTTTVGTDNTGYRTTYTTSTFDFSQFSFEAVFEVECLGDSNVLLNFAQKPHGAAGPVTHVTMSFPRKLTEKRTVVTGLFDVKKLQMTVDGLTSATLSRDMDYTLESVELESACADIAPGDASHKMGSVHSLFSLGRGNRGTSAGSLRVDAETLTDAIYTPASLRAVVSSAGGVEVVRVSGTDVIRQVKAPQLLADVVTLNATSYEIRFYALSDVGAQNGTTKIYAISGTPFVTHRFEKTDVGATKSLRITETKGSVSKATEYSYDTTTGWSLSRGDGLRKEAEITTVVAGDKVKTTSVRNASNVVQSQTARTYHTYAWGEELIQEVIDPSGAALATNYTYYSDIATTAPGYGKLKQRTDAQGGWVRYTYDATGRVLKTIRPFLNAAPATTNEALCRVAETIYDTIADADGDTLPEVRTTTIEWLQGVEIGRNYRIEWSNAVTLGSDTCKDAWEIQCVSIGAAWNATANLVTKTLTYAGGSFAGGMRRMIRPDGTVMLVTNSVATNGILTTTTKNGVPNVAFDNVVDGQSTTSTTNTQGQQVAETVSDVASGLTISSWVATGFDATGRPTRIDYADGTYETRTYACCGLASLRDRGGIVTTYTYDALGRQITTTRAGITTQTNYDAAGRVTSRVRIGSDASAMTQETNTYDAAGRQTERRDALSRLTTYATSYDSTTGQTTQTTTQPDSGTIIEVIARDGSRVSLSGTATAPHSYDYGVDVAGVYVKDTAIGVNGSGQPTSTEWTKSYTDFTGRPFKTVYADSAVNLSYYNAAGQLERQVDPDGVTTLFAYNTRGEQTTVAVDLNGSNAIDFNGNDRIVRTTSGVATKTEASINYTVQRTTTEVWETASSTTATTIGIAEQSTDGLRSWQTTRGLTTKIVTTLDGAGGKTVTTTAPAGGRNVQVFTAGRLASGTIRDSAGVQVSAVTYAYDAHGRMTTATDARNGATTMTYFADDQIATVTTPDPDSTRTGSGYDAQATTYAYDTAGRVSSVTQPDGGIVTTTYWYTGAVKRTSGARTYPVEYTYDPQGRVKTLTTWRDFAGDTGKAVTTWTYDAARGWLLNKRYADSTGPTYTYKPSGRVLTRVWARTPAITTTYSYNAAGDLTGTDYSDATPDVTLTYDRQGRPASVVDAAGTRTFGYHATGQLQSETYAGGLLPGVVVNRTFDAFARLDTLAVPSVVSASYAYDTASRLSTVTGGANVATYTYAANSSLVAQIAFTNSSTTRLTTTKTYDKLDRLTSIGHAPSSGSPSSYTYTYNSANQRTRVTREDSAYWGYAYDSLGQVTAGSKFLSGGTPALGLAYGYAYDDIGNRKTAQVNGQSSTYTANSLNQYSQRTVPGVVDVTGAAAAGATVTVGVDGGAPQSTSRQGEVFYKQTAVSNASTAQYPSLKITGVKNTAGSSGEDAVTEVTRSSFLPRTPETYSYDTDGNLVDDARWHYAWDGENRLISMETSTTAAGLGVPKRKLEFAYDGQGRRVRKRVSDWNSGGGTYQLTSDVRFVYDGWNLIAELNGATSNSCFRTYVWGLDLSGGLQGAGGIGGLLEVLDVATSTDHFVGFDGNGNVVALIRTSTGTPSARYDYNAFGETVVSEGSASDLNPFRFSTKLIDADTSLIYYGLRYCDSRTGGWLARDPIEERGGANLYAFVGNNGINNFDPLGLEDAQADYVAKSFINGLPSLGSLKGRAGFDPVTGVSPGFLADVRLQTFGSVVGDVDAFNQNPTTDARDGQYRMYTRVTIKASCCKDGAPTVSIVSTDTDAGREGPGLSGTINLSQPDITTVGSTARVHWKGWGRPNAAAEPGMQWVAMRTSTNIWHDITIVVSCKDGKPSFQLGGVVVSKFPTFRLWKDGQTIRRISQGALSDLWQPDSSDSSFVSR
jgi:RHS repeat-associated protein